MAGAPNQGVRRGCVQPRFGFPSAALFQSNVAQPAGSDYFQIGAYAEHIPTGLFIYGAYGHLDPDSQSRCERRLPTIPGTSRLVFVQHCNPLGHTVFYGEYLRAENNNASFFDRRYCCLLMGTAPIHGIAVTVPKPTSRSGAWALSRKSTLLRCRYGSSTATSARATMFLASTPTTSTMSAPAL